MTARAARVVLRCAGGGAQVARLYDADFANLEVVTAWLFPENVPLVQV